MVGRLTMLLSNKWTSSELLLPRGAANQVADCQCL